MFGFMKSVRSMACRSLLVGTRHLIDYGSRSLDKSRHATAGVAQTLCAMAGRLIVASCPRSLWSPMALFFSASTFSVHR